MTAEHEIEKNPGSLQKALGLAFGVAVAVGGTVGVGILRRPGTVAQLLPHGWAIFAIWTAGGVYAMLGALCVAELSTMMPRAGGFFVFTHRAFGPACGFAIGWCDWLANTAAVAYGAIASAELLPRFAPALQNWVQPVALTIAGTFCAAQCVGVRASGRLQRLLSFLVCIAFAGLVVACFFFRLPHAAGLTPNSSPVHSVPLHSVPILAGAWVLAFRAVIVSYDGWYEPAYFSEESVNPGRTVPRSLVFGVLLVMSIYLLVNAGLLHVLGLQNLAGAELPVADAARRLAGSWGDLSVVVLSLLALLPMTSAGLLGAARIFYGLARDFLHWSGPLRVNAGGTPWVATLLTTAVAMLLIATGTFDALLAMSGVFMVILYCSAYASLMVLRRREPNAPRPFVLFAYPWIPLLLLATGILFLGAITVSDLSSTLAALGLLVISYPVYRLFRTRSIG